MKKLKVIFMGTPLFAVPILEVLIKNTNVVGVVTQPDKEVGRKQIITSSPIKKLALENKIKVMQPLKIKTDFKDVLSLEPDIIITCAYGQFIPKEILDCPKYGCINVHASLLPKLRGGAPIHHAIIDGATKTGITIMNMDIKMDAGDILNQVEVDINRHDTTGDLYDKLIKKAPKLLMDTLPKIISNSITPIKQDETKVTFGYNITREEELIDFNQSTENIYNLIRGLNPHPGAYAMLHGKRIKIWSAEIGEYKSDHPGEIFRICPKGGIGVATLDGEIILYEIQIAGKKRMMVKEYFNGIDPESLLGKQFR